MSASIDGVRALVMMEDGCVKIAIWAAALFVVFNTSLSHAAIYEWVPDPDPRHGGMGAITLTPGGVSPTDTDFTTSVVTDFQFLFENGVAVTFSDIVINNAPAAVGGLITGDMFFTESVFTDNDLVFAAASADYHVSASLPLENNGGQWILSSLVPGPDPDPGPGNAIPEPTTIAIFTLALMGLGAARRRRSA
jgi:hypothetical protein